jgi:hypothetical protein
MQRFKKLMWMMLVGGAVTCGPRSASLAQVSPSEITDPQLKVTEQAYLKQLVTVSHAIAKTPFPFPFVLNRYANLDPKQVAGADTRGLEFVKFHDRVTLKVSGDYGAAFNADLLTENQRANRVLDDVIVPLLRLIADSFPSSANFESYGFEISWHVRRRTHDYDYEGREIVALVVSRADAARYLRADRESERQDVLGRSEIYVNGKEFRLALGEREPIPIAEAERASAPPPAPASDSDALPATSSSETRLARIYEDPLAGLLKPKSEATALGADRSASPSSRAGERSDQPPPAAAGFSQADAEVLQKEYRAQLDALAQEGVSKFHFVDYASPSFVVFRNRIYVQLTLRNPEAFDKNATSIYKRAAQSFDLFLAPLLHPIIDKVPKNPGIAGLDITVINQLNSKPTPSSEALEFICPLPDLRQFGDDEITNQDLINHSIVLVNGVRIALSLQQVE